MWKNKGLSNILEFGSYILVKPRLHRASILSNTVSLVCSLKKRESNAASATPTIVNSKHNEKQRRT